MEFVRTAIKNKFSSDQVLLRSTAALLGIYLIFSVVMGYFATRVESGPALTLARKIVCSGDYAPQGAMGIAVDEAGNAYIADSGRDRVLVIGTRGSVGRIIDLHKKPGGKDKKTRFPTSVVLGSDQRLFVGNYSTGEISVYDRSGKLMDVLPHREDKPNLASIKVLAMAADKSGNIYVSDAGHHRIVVFDSGGKLKLVFGKQGYYPGDLSFVNGIAIDDANRRIIVLDSNNLRLQFYNFEGKFIGYLPLNKTKQNLFVAPRGLVYSPEKKIFYITETLLDKVIALDPTGKVVAMTKDVPLEYPHGIVLGPDNLLYVTNREGNGIIVLNM